MSQSIAARLKRKVPLLLLSILVLPALLVAFSSQLVGWYGPHFLAKHGVEANINDVRIDWVDKQFTLNDFTTKGSNNERLAVKKLSLGWSWQGIFSNQFSLSNIQVEGLRLDVLLQNNRLTKIGPLELAKFTSQSSNKNTQSDPWSLAINQIDLSDFNVCYYQTTKPQCINWQSIQINSNMSLSSENSPHIAGQLVIEELTIDQLLSLKQASFKELSVDKNLVKWSNITLNEINFQQTTQNSEINAQKLELNNGNFDFANQAMILNLKSFKLDNIALNPNQANISVINLTIANIGFSDLTANLNDLTASLQQLQINQLDAQTNIEHQTQPLATLDNISISKLAFDGQQLSGIVDEILVNNVKLWSLTREQRYGQLIDLKQLSLRQLAGSQKTQQLKGLELQNIKLMEDLTKSDETSLINVDNLIVQELTHGDAIKITDISLNGLTSWLSFEKDQGLNVNRWLATQPSEQDKPKTVESTPKPIKINSVDIKDSQIAISENTTGANITHNINDIVVNVQDIALNGINSKPMLVDMAAMINQSGKISAKGSIHHDSNNLLADINGKIEHLNLTEFSAYSAKHTGYRVDQGQLSSDIKIKIDKNLIDTSFDLLLNKFDLSKLQAHEKDQSHKELGIPLATAFNLLKDGDNNIQLAIPISGDLDNPQFSAADVIRTVSFKAIKSAVLFAYSPLGFATVASGVVDLATAMRFKPIEFSSAQITLTDKQQQRLNETAKVLKDKPQVSLVLCANATHLDVPEQKQGQEQAETPIDALIDLAKQRQQAVKDYLVNEQAIEQHRLLLCNVKVDSKPSAPKVEISL